MRGAKLNLCSADHEVVIYTADQCPICALRRQIADLQAALAAATSRKES